jgi:hypothetical protein
MGVKKMKILAVLFLFFTFSSVVHAEVLMYQDDGGKWHGVSSIDQVPEKYKKQIESVKLDNPPIPVKKQIANPNNPEELIESLQAISKDEWENMECWQAESWIDQIDHMEELLKIDTHYTIEVKSADEKYFRAVKFQLQMICDKESVHKRVDDYFKNR